MIPQDPEIFKTTIKENITMGVAAGRKEIRQAIKLARFDSVVAHLKNHLKTNVMEKGVSLSGGEKQRLALARGLLRIHQYDMLLLDEPTSSVDSTNELAIYKNIFTNFPNRTVISTVHRLHLLPQFDYVYLFDKGKIIAQGSFETLMKNKYFVELWANYKHES